MPNFIFISPHFPSSYWRFCIALKNRGFNVLGIGDAPYSEVSEECKRALTEYYCCGFMDHYENEAAAVRYYKEKYGEIDYLESNNEYWLEKDAQLRQDFDVKHGVRPDEIRRYKYKSTQKEFYKKAGLKCARYCLSDKPEEVRDFAKLVGYPIFAKPDNGVGAQDTHKIKNDEDLEAFLRDFAPRKTYIIEEYINGTIISYDGVSNSNADVIFETSEYFELDNATIVEQELDDMYYCIPHDKLSDEFRDMGRRAIKSFEVKNRFFHLEWFMLKEDHPYLGPKGTIVPLEANLRPAGGYTPDLINFANSVNCYEIYGDTIAFDENRQYMDYQTYYSACCSRRFKYDYQYSEDQILEMYPTQVCYRGVYPVVLRDDMGDTFIMAKFDTIEELREFDDKFRAKK